MEYLLQCDQVAIVWQNDSNRTIGRKFGAGKYKPRGIPDIVGMFLGGRFFGIEIKKPGGKVSDEQILFQQKIKRFGGSSLLAFSLEEVQAWIGGQSTWLTK